MHAALQGARHQRKAQRSGGPPSGTSTAAPAAPQRKAWRLTGPRGDLAAHPSRCCGDPPCRPQGHPPSLRRPRPGAREAPPCRPARAPRWRPRSAAGLAPCPAGVSAFDATRSQEAAMWGRVECERTRTRAWCEEGRCAGQEGEGRDARRTAEVTRLTPCEVAGATRPPVTGCTQL
jgi:hypothetical protein